MKNSKTMLWARRNSGEILKKMQRKYPFLAVIFSSVEADVWVKTVSFKFS